MIAVDAYRAHGAVLPGVSCAVRDFGPVCYVAVENVDIADRLYESRGDEYIVQVCPATPFSATGVSWARSTEGVEPRGAFLKQAVYRAESSGCEEVREGDGVEISFDVLGTEDGPADVTIDQGGVEITKDKVEATGSEG